MCDLLTILLLTFTPLTPAVDVAEVNTYGGRGACQIILWEWSYEHDCFVVVAWRSVTTDAQVDTELSKVKYNHFRESWSFHDPEVDNRAVVPIHSRRKIKW